MPSQGTKNITAAIIAVADIAIYQHFTPRLTDIKEAAPFNNNLEGSERTALLVATGLTVLTAGLMKSAEVFMVGGAVIIGLDFAIKHANATNPATGSLDTADNATSFPMPDYSA
jgi:hypothetical protein